MDLFRGWEAHSKCVVLEIQESLKLSLIIPTYQRAHLWKRGLLVDAIQCQTVQPHEILICDDGSTDGTAVAARKALPQARVFRTTVPKITAHHDSALADNVLFREATGDVVIHIDDDGYVNPRLVEVAALLGGQAVFYGHNVFVDPVNFGIIGMDDRIGKLKCRQHQMVSMPPTLCQGALWTAPLALLRRLGGHEMEHVGYRGCDSRLGVRLQSEAQCWFVNMPQFAFFHLGKSKYRELKDSGEKYTYDQWHAPGLDGYQWEVTANGGERFWQDGLAGMYEEMD